MNDNALSFQHLKDSYPIRQNLYGLWSTEGASIKKKESGNSFWAVVGVLTLLIGAFLLGYFWKEFMKILSDSESEEVEEGTNMKVEKIEEALK
jgi:flagellar biosynthesis/type III secretory pathway M-ring protein FliF/YscJ